jgi:FKBP-type peptidyl-prolyl cis-trans isomerase
MMCRFIKFILFIAFVAVWLVCCKPSSKNSFKFQSPGYWYKLLAFNTESHVIEEGSSAWVNAIFKTQHDSVFFDTQNDLKDRFFIKIDTVANGNFLKRAVSYAAEGDSIALLIKPQDFFEQQFKNKVPWFCSGDTVVKVFLKVKKILSPRDYGELTRNIENNEQKEIESYFTTAAEYELARDSMGFFWVERPQGDGTITAIAGDVITLSYEGGFLNGRVIDVSPPGFQVIYGTPDQLIRGLNYVIGRLKKGQTSKIILPSQLAFGQNGSSNGSVPPFTPMLYKISITDIKTKEAD